MKLKFDMFKFRQKAAAHQEAITNLHQSEQEIRAQHAECLLAREQLLVAPEPIDTIVSRMRAHHAALAASREAGLIQTLVDSYGSRYVEAEDGARIDCGSLPVHVATGFRPGSFTMADLVTLFPEQLSDRFEALIRKASHVSPGPVESRAAQLADLDRQILALDQLHDELVQHAAGVGIQLAPLPAAAERRRRAEEQAREQQRIAEAQAAQQREHANRRAVGGRAS